MRLRLCPALILPLLLGVASCVAETAATPAASLAPGPVAATNDAPAPAQSSTIDVQPSRATYRCGARGTLLVQNMRSSVQVTDPEGDSVILPAAPASQQTRYGMTGYALVLEGNDALYMKGGKEPVNCRR